MKYCHKLDFDADLNNKFKPLIRKNRFFRFQNQVNFLITQLKYCQKLDFEADPNNKFKPLIKRLVFSLSKSIEFPFITQLKYCRKLEFEVESKLCLGFLYGISC